MLIVNARCKRCGGNLYIERNIEGDTLKCLACGFERDIPAEVKPVVNITQEVINVAAKIPETVVKTPGQILYEAHAKEAGLRSPWKALSQENRERYERKANGTWERKQSVKKPKPVRPEASFRGHDAKPVLPPWSEIKNESEAVKIAWLEAVSCIKS